MEKVKFIDTDWQEKEFDLISVIWEDGMWNSWMLKIMSYNACKKLFAAAKLSFACEPKLVCTPSEWNKQQHIWLVGMKTQDWTVHYSEWEASKYNTGKIVQEDVWGKKVITYVEATEIDAKYRSRMAYKRAYCRCVLDMLGFDDVYSAEDAKDFQKTQKINKEIDSSMIEAL